MSDRTVEWEGNHQGKWKWAEIEPQSIDVIFLLMLIRRMPVWFPEGVCNMIFHYMKEIKNEEFWEKNRGEYMKDFPPYPEKIRKRQIQHFPGESMYFKELWQPSYRYETFIPNKTNLVRQFRGKILATLRSRTDKRPLANNILDIIKSGVGNWDTYIFFHFVPQYQNNFTWNNAITQAVEDDDTKKKKRRNRSMRDNLQTTMMENKSKRTHFRKNEKFMYKKKVTKKNKNVSRIYQPNTKMRASGWTRSGRR
jgi:hypothetical protein